MRMIFVFILFCAMYIELRSSHTVLPLYWHIVFQLFFQGKMEDVEFYAKIKTKVEQN